MGNIVVSVVSGTVTGISEYKESRNLKSAILNGVFDGVASAAPGFSDGYLQFKRGSYAKVIRGIKDLNFTPIKSIPLYVQAQKYSQKNANKIPAFFYQVDYCLYDELPDDIAYFHAQWRRERLTEKTKDYTILDGVKGKGHYIGTYMALTTLERYWWGEGEMKFYIDGDEEYPTICGTGTEDYFGGSWSFAKQVDGKTVEQNYNTPYLGYPYYSAHDELIHNFYHNDDCPPMRGFYRWHLQDPICFEEDLRVTIQQIGVGYRGLFERQDDVASVAYWYQTLPHAPFQPLMSKEDRWPR